MNRRVETEIVVVVNDRDNKMTLEIDRQQEMIRVATEKTNVPYESRLPNKEERIVCESTTAFFSERKVRCGLILKENQLVGFYGLIP